MSLHSRVPPKSLISPVIRHFLEPPVGGGFLFCRTKGTSDGANCDPGQSQYRALLLVSFRDAAADVKGFSSFGAAL